MAGKIEDNDLDESGMELYNSDPRAPCKYGLECYQTNPLHKKKYKHPPNPSKRQHESPESADNDKLKKQKTGADSTSKTTPTKTGSEVSSSVNQGKQEQISDSEDEETEEWLSNVPDSDLDSRTALRPSKREEISDSDSDSSPVQDTIEVKDNKPPLAKQSDALSEKGEQQQAEQVSPKNNKEVIKQMFLVEMPEDFYNFWLLCNSLSKNNPAGAFNDAGLLLVGPYDVLAGKLKSYETNKKDMYLIHWRYYYDPPEFQTVIKGDDKSRFHMGYYRDDPASLPCFVASNSAAKDYIIKPMAENIFGAVNSFLEFAQRTSNPFQKMKLSRLQKSVQSWANDNKYTLDVNSPSMKSRRSKVVSKTFHQAGIVVPVEKKTEVGYRELIETDAKLKTILKMIVESRNDREKTIYLEKLQPIITAADIANDECDFGTSLELGVDLFSFGGEVLHGSILHLLTTAYTLLRRPAFKDIIEAHLKKRRRGSDLSMFETTNVKS